MKRSLSSHVALAVGLIILAIIARLLPHPPNFAPIAALAIFGGAYLPKRWSFAVPAIALIASDILIGFYNPGVMLAVYASFALAYLIGRSTRNKKRPTLILGGTIIGSIAFFLITNAAVWMFGSGYDPGIAGLAQSYVAGLPFFKNTLLSDLLYISLLAGAMEFAASRSSKALPTDRVLRRTHLCGPRQWHHPSETQPQAD